MPESTSTSASTGTCPACTIAFTTPQKVIVGTRTRDPLGSRRARNDSSSASVQDETASACLAPTQEANSSSNAAASGPVVSHPDDRARCAATCASTVTSGREKGTVRDMATPRSVRVHSHPESECRYGGTQSGSTSGLTPPTSGALSEGSSR